MPNTHLRVHAGRSPSDAGLTPRQIRELDTMTGMSKARTVSVSLKQIVPLLIDAADANRSWLEDFADDTVSIDSDLYDVLLAYQQVLERNVA